jgi:hypothetical protein
LSSLAAATAAAMAATALWGDVLQLNVHRFKLRMVSYATPRECEQQRKACGLLVARLPGNTNGRVFAVGQAGVVFSWQALCYALRAFDNFSTC